MGVGLFSLGGIPASPVYLDGPYGGPTGWLLIVFSVFALAMLVWLLFGTRPERLTLEVVRCPIERRRARLFVRRQRDGRITGIQSCSLMSPPSRITCTRSCLTSFRS